jgi:hypothetical protein
MSFKVECTACGEDCSHSYGTWRGYPYHFNCLPSTKQERAYFFETEEEAAEAADNGRNTGGKSYR